ncbi:MAG: pyruvate kinase [Clostridia bacterium]|nr:pyruvate kinase [Clostridia bacterium]
MRKTKIVCTIGPASRNEATIRKMIEAGMNVARLNFSHGTHEYHKETIDLIKAVRKDMGVPLAIMLDTKGPEIRLKNFRDHTVELKDGQLFTLTVKDVEGDETRASVTYAGLPRCLKKGNMILINDGKISLRVESADEEEIRCTVLHGGPVSDHKGVNVPDVHVDMPHMSEQDKKDLYFGVQEGVDYVAASFIRCAKDVTDIRKFLNYHGGHDIRIISKIENREGIDNFDEILEKSDGIMVARGDMGVEVEYNRLPGIQKRLISRCYLAGKMVITATQMLDSMMSNPMPTRAEITDVANAVFDGTSAVMLSGESAAGQFPVESVATMANIAAQAEKDASEIYGQRIHNYDIPDKDITNAVCDAACRAANDVRARVIISVTKSGGTARNLSKFRPSQPIIAATPEEKTFNQLSLSWGVYPVKSLYQQDYDHLLTHAVDCARQIDMIDPGDTVIIIAGIPLGQTGSTNVIKVETV